MADQPAGRAKSSYPRARYLLAVSLWRCGSSLHRYRPGFAEQLLHGFRSPIQLHPNERLSFLVLPYRHGPGHGLCDRVPCLGTGDLAAGPAHRFADFGGRLFAVVRVALDNDLVMDDVYKPRRCAANIIMQNSQRPL